LLKQAGNKKLAIYLMKLFTRAFVFIAIFLLSISWHTRLHAQGGGGLAGRIVDVKTQKALPGVLVKIAELDTSQFSSQKGEFVFRGLPAGEYTLSFQAPAYGKTILLNVPVIAGQVVYKEIFLEKSETEGEKFYIGGIEVTAERDLLPEKAATTTTISSGEIEHIQASSLGDVLEMIPGQRFDNPGLENVKQIQLRQTSTEESADRNATMGTQIIVDGVPVSNNANMQLDTKLNDAVTYRVTVNSGVDLRQIPAENIQQVEVVRGIPPARYGDLTAGAVLVSTKIGHTPYRAKYKVNPRNKELNLSGGYSGQSFMTNYSLNYAKSLRNIRVPGDTYSRLAGQLNFQGRFWRKKLEWQNRFYYTRTLDEQGVREGDLFQTERYNRNYTARWNSNLDYRWNKKRRLTALFSVNVSRQNTFYKRILSRDAGVISDRMTPGTQEGYFVYSYTTRLRVKSRAWNLFGRLEYNAQTHKMGLLHDWQAGLNIRHEFNNGPGREFDVRFPPGINDNEGDRPRSYDNVPALTQATFYLQDEITGRLWRDFNLQLGFRYDLFDPFNLDWGLLDDGVFPVESHHGNFFSPRVNFVQHLSRNTQFRLGYGRTAKAPPLSMIYPNPVYFDIVDSMYYHPDSVEKRLAIVSTYIFDRTNENLKAFTEDKYEVSLDQRIGRFGFSLTGFYQRMHNGFELNGFVPVSFTKYYRPNWPSPQPGIPRDTVLLDYRKAINSVESESRGVEFSLRTKQLPVINTTIRVNAAYHFSKSWWQDNHYEYFSTLRYDPNLHEKVRPFWNRTGSWRDELIIHYRFDTMAKSLGLWFTVAVQQIALERDKITGLDDSLAVGYIRADGSVYRIPEGAVVYTRRNPEIFYGMEFSMVVDDFVRFLKRY